MLLLKLIVVPIFLALLSLAAKKWGPSIAGLLSGFPVVAGPILAFIAVEQGAQFASKAAQGALLAVVSTIAFAVVFVRSCQRFGWLISGIVGFAAWACAAMALSFFPDDLLAAGLFSIIVVMISPLLLPAKQTASAKATPLPTSEIAARMVSGAILVMLVTASAQGLGTRWAGLLAMFPVLTSVLGIFLLRANGKIHGPSYIANLFRGLFRGFYAFCTFCVSASFLLTRTTPWLAFGSAVGLALLVQGFVYLMIQKSSSASH